MQISQHKKHLAPPLLPLGKDAKTGRPKKVELGAWMLPVMGVLARLKGLRGGPLDVFGYTAERRMERGLIAEYEAQVLSLVDTVTDARMALATEIAAAPALIAGYGPVKEAGLEAYRIKLAGLMADYERLETPRTVEFRREAALAG